MEVPEREIASGGDTHENKRTVSSKTPFPSVNLRAAEAIFVHRIIALSHCPSRNPSSRIRREHAELQPQGRRAALAALLAREQDLPHSRRQRPAEVLRPRHVPLSFRLWAARRPPR